MVIYLTPQQTGEMMYTVFFITCRWWKNKWKKAVTSPQLNPRIEHISITRWKIQAVWSDKYAETTLVNSLLTKIKDDVEKPVLTVNLLIYNKTCVLREQDVAAIISTN